MNKKVSIVVPVYNSHLTLPKCLDSLIAQTYPDIEIICVNDKSKDNSIDVIKEYQQKDSRVILVDHEKNKNAGGARNSGIKAATGTYICFVDNDDWLTPDAINVLVSASDDCKIDIVVPRWCQYWSESHKVDMQNLVVGATKEENCNYALLYGCRILGCLIRREIFLKNNLFFPEYTFFEDNAIGEVLLYCSNEIKVIDRVLYYYQMVDGSSSRSLNMIKIRDRIKTTDLLYQNMNRLNYVNSENKLFVECRYLTFSYHTILMLRNVNSKEALISIKGIIEKIKYMLPNKLINEHYPEYQSVLEHPIYTFYKFKMRQFVKKLRHHRT